jgi:hypothetical protein
MKKSLLIATAASAISCSVGVAVGYKIAERRLAQQFEERFRRELEASTSYYEHAAKHPRKYATPEEAAAALIKPGTILEEKPHRMPMPKVPAERVAYHKVAGAYLGEEEKPEGDPDDDQDVLQIMFPAAPENNMPDQNVFTAVPHVIDQETFINNESGWEQSTLTWYVVDEVLADDSDKIVDDVEGIVGRSNLDRFGEGSSDNNIVHVRNPRLNLEFEIVRHNGSYRELVLGSDDSPPQRPSGRS